MKFVSVGTTASGAFIDFAASLHFNKYAMFHANTLMFCIPSSSFKTSSGVFPCTMFQYLPETTGISFIIKYLFNWSNAAVVPALLALTMAHPNFNLNALLLEKNALSKKVVIAPLALA